MCLESLKEIDGLREIEYAKSKCYLHNDHRWNLPVIFHQQDRGILPKPCNLITFDAHHDTNNPPSLQDIVDILESGIDLNKIINLCHNLSQKDDDWIKTGIELGMIKDVVIFGVRDICERNRNETYPDNRQNNHTIYQCYFPNSELKNQGHLSDVTIRTEFSTLWDILSWDYSIEHRFHFQRNTQGIILDFDLDCFTMKWEEYIFPWDEEVFQDRLLSNVVSTYSSGWTGKKFIDGLIDQSKLLLISREPECCGGDDKSNIILHKFNQYIFNNELNLQ